MESFSGGGNGNRPSPRKELQLQGPRPSALKVNKDSHKIRKPPVPPPAHHQQPPQHPPATTEIDRQQPVIIYAVSPKVIHTTVTDFLPLVQRLTGNIASASATASSSSSSAGNLSPAARLASIERTSPSERQRERDNSNNMVDGFDIMGLLENANLEVGGQAPAGILSPAPATLPPISPGMFSPAPADPFLYGYGNMFVPSPSGNMLVPSPSGMFSAPIVSPSPSSSDFFNPFFDF